MLFGVGVACHILYSVVRYLYVSCSGSITSVWGRESYFVCYRLLVIMWFLFREVSSSSGAWDELLFIVPLPGPSILLF